MSTAYLSTDQAVSALRYYASHAAAFGGLAAAVAFGLTGHYNEALVSGIAALSAFGLPIAPGK